MFERSEFGFRYSVRNSVFVIPHGTQLTFIHSELGVRYITASALQLTLAHLLAPGVVRERGGREIFRKRDDHGESFYGVRYAK